MSKAYRAEARVRSLRRKLGLSPENVRKIQVAAVQAVALYGAELWWDETKNIARATDLRKFVNHNPDPLQECLELPRLGRSSRKPV
jgi:hypothetical protein